MAAQADRNRLRVRVDGTDDSVYVMDPDDHADADSRHPEVRPLPATSIDRAAGQRRYEVTVDGWVLRASVEPEARAVLRERASQGREVDSGQGEQRISAQIPGRLVRLWVAEGDTVEAGQRLLAIEAMKMENEVRAPRDGTVVSIKATVGASVELGDELLTVR
jgi:biotin carboxyl carrier protein